MIFPYSECDILAVELSGEIGLKQVLAALLEAEINIHYVYAFTRRPEGRVAFALHVEDSRNRGPGAGTPRFQGAGSAGYIPLRPAFCQRGQGGPVGANRRARPADPLRAGAAIPGAVRA